MYILQTGNKYKVTPKRGSKITRRICEISFGRRKRLRHQAKCQLSQQDILVSRNYVPYFSSLYLVYSGKKYDELYTIATFPLQLTSRLEEEPPFRLSLSQPKLSS